MGLVRSTMRRVAERVARTVADDDLFEKPGERASTPPFDSVPPPPDRDLPEEPVVSGAEAEALSGPCQPVGAAALQAACATGGQPLVLHHWATWCEPCEEELPRIEQLAGALGDQARILGVSWELFEGGGDPTAVADRVAAYQEHAGLTWPSLLYTDAPESLFDSLALSFERIPQTQVLGADGRVLKRFDGPLTAADVDEVVGLIAGES